MDELIVSGKKYISSKRAAEISGYAKDYIGQLARLGKIAGIRAGRAWYVEESAVLAHVSSENTSQDSNTEKRLDRALLAGKPMITVPAHLYKVGSIPRTWSSVTYSYEDHDLLPGISKTAFVDSVEQDSEYSVPTPVFEANDQSKEETLKIKVLRANIEPKTAVTRVGKPIVFDIAAPTKLSSVNVKSPLSVRQTSLLPAFTLVGGAALFIFFVSGLFLSSQISYTPQNEVYAASVLLSVDNVKEIVQDSQFIHGGVSALATFYQTITGSFSVFLKTGFDFIFH